MNRTEELNDFLVKSYDLITCKYILAETKIIGLLKSIAGSETLVAIMESALYGFDYEAAKKRYYTASSVGDSNRGDYVAPDNLKDVIALTFSVLMDIDSGKINFSEFLKKYFYENGSFTESYTTFLNSVIKPFRNAVKIYMEGVIDGKLKNPKDELKLNEEAFTTKVLPKTVALNEDSLKKSKQLIEIDRNRVLSCDLTDEEKADLIKLLDKLIEFIDFYNKENLLLAFTGYKMAALAYKKLNLTPHKLYKFLQEGNAL